MLLVGAWWLASAAALAAVEARGPQVWALVGARVVVAPGQVLDGATILVRDGVIEAVGAGLTVPAEARRVELEGKSVFPGFIEAYLEREWPKDALDGDGGKARPRLHPERDVAPFAFDADRAGDLRAAGFTTALVAPAPGVFRGTSAWLNLGDQGLAENLLCTEVAHHAGLNAGEEPGYGDSFMGTVALFRQSLLDAAWYAVARPAGAAPGRPRVPFDRALAALSPVARREQRLVIETESPLATLRAARLAKELDLDAVIVASGREYRRPELVAAAGVPLIVPIAFPDPPEVGKEGDALGVELSDLRHWDEAPSNPAALARAGALFALSAHRLEKPKDLLANLRQAILRGLSPETALAALTTVPAQLFGLTASAGTIEAGKMANFIVVDGPLPWAEGAIVEAVWIDGRRYDVDPPKKKEPAPTAAEAPPAGDPP